MQLSTKLQGWHYAFLGYASWGIFLFIGRRYFHQ